jgi:hypothetical protein
VEIQRMADETAVNPQTAPQITDAVTQSNVRVVGESPAIAAGLLPPDNIHFQNAIADQQQREALIRAQRATRED